MNIESLRNFCLSLPHATEDIKWKSDLCFCIGAKMFCVTNLNPDQEGATFKVKPEEFGEMLTRPGIVPAPYIARYHGILVENWAALSELEWEHFVKQSYELTKQKLPASIRKTL